MKFVYHEKPDLSLKEYLSIDPLVGPPSLNAKTWKRFTLLLASIMCFFSSWTFLLGIALLAFSIFLIFTPRVLETGRKRAYENYLMLGKPLTFGVSTEGLYLKTPNLEAHSKWKNVTQWRTNGDWLILYPKGLHKHIYRVSGLKRSGHYESVLNLAKEHSVEFDNPDGQKSNKSRP